jgi:hypothetical protein
MSYFHDNLPPGLDDDPDDLVSLCVGILISLSVILAVALVVTILVLPGACHASSRWSPAVEARLVEAWPDVLAAADLAGVDPLDLASQAIVETAVRPIEGWYEPVLGVLQVRPATWRRLLAGAGYDDHDLMDSVWGWYAAAEVLAYLRAQYGREGALLQCLWSDGLAALRYRQDCLYSRQVARHGRHVAGMLGRQSGRDVVALGEQP